MEFGLNFSVIKKTLLSAINGFIWKDCISKRCGILHAGAGVTGGVEAAGSIYSEPLILINV